MITVPGEFSTQAQNGIQTIQFADGTIMNWTQIDAAAWYRAGTGDVTLNVPDGGGIAGAGPGNDVINVGDRYDTGQSTVAYASTDGDLTINAIVWSWNTIANVLQFSDLNASDVAFSRSGNDLSITVNSTGKVITVPGEFSSQAQNGIQTIQFADGTIMNWTQIDAAAWYRAGTGDVTLNVPDGGGIAEGGPGNDVINVGDRYDTGQSTVAYASADGDLTINAIVWSWYTISNVLQFSDLNASDVAFSRNGNDLSITVNSTGKVITLPGEFSSQAQNGIQSVQFADGAVWEQADIQAATLSGSVFETAAQLASNIDGLNANAAVTSITMTDAGAPILVLSQSEMQFDSKALSEISNASYIVEAVDPASSSVLSETVMGANASVTLASGASAVVSGNSDVISLSGGNSVSSGGTNETFAYSAGSGSDELAATNNAATGVVAFASGISDQNLWFQESSAGLQIDVMGTNNVLTLADWFGAAGGGGGVAAPVQSFTAAGLHLDTQVAQLVQAMAAYSAATPGFNPASVAQAPNDPTLQTMIAAAWH